MLLKTYFSICPSYTTRNLIITPLFNSVNPFNNETSPKADLTPFQKKIILYFLHKIDVLDMLARVEADWVSWYLHLIVSVTRTTSRINYTLALCFYQVTKLITTRVADVARAREQRSPKGQGLLRKEGPPTYAILSQNLVLSQFMRFLRKSSWFGRAFNESQCVSKSFDNHKLPAFLKS